MQVLIKDKSQIKLKRLNEGANVSNPKYKFTGVFTPCSYPGHTLKNRNNRIYQEAEVLKHIGYLRDKIKNDGCILGELDHPENRFEVYLKEASHKITDLWWDQQTHCVMGTLELLPTPNGKIAQELVESGYPLYVSSRSAGDVDKTTDEVVIYQIFTYDLVCTPGFAEARLTRMNESFNPKTVAYLNESAASSNKTKNLSSSFSLNENTEVYKLDEEIQLNKDMTNYMNTHKINIKELAKPLLEDNKPEKPEISVKKKKVEKKEEDSEQQETKPGEAPTPKQLDDDNAKSVGLEFRDTTPDVSKVENSGNDDLSYADHLNDGKDSDADKKRDDVIDITVTTTEDAKDEESEDNDKKDEVVEITANKDSEEDKDSGSEDKDSEENKDDESSEEDKEEEKKQEEAAKKFKNKADQIEKKIDKKMDKYKDLLNSVDAKKTVKESIYRSWPFSVSLSEDNFSKFCQLSAEDKNKCASFIFENQIYDILQINEMFMTPLNVEKQKQKNWLRLADKEYIDLYTKAPKSIQDAIEESAKFLILDNKADVDEFWHRTGLMEMERQKESNYQFVERYKNIINPTNDNNVDGYSKDLIKLTEEMMTE